MSTNDPQPLARRIFLRRMGRASGAALAIPPLLGGLATSPASAQDATRAEDEKSRHPGYLSLGP